MQRTFLTALCSQCAKLWESRRVVPPSQLSLDAFVLEDRLLYSATALPVDAIDANSQDISFGVSLSEIDAMLRLVEQDLGGLTEVDADAGVAQSFSTIDAQLPDDSEVAAATVSGSVESSQRHDIAFVDGSLDNLTQLVDQLRDSYADGGTLDVVLLDDRTSGLEQITAALAGAGYEYSSMHLVTHGAAGGIQLGCDWLAADALAANQQLIQSWSDGLTADADLLLYACQVGSTAGGQEFVQNLSALLDVDVAASTDITGASEIGGNWDLEFQVGQIEAHGFSLLDPQDEWQGLLSIYTVTNTADSGAGSLRQAILDANSNAGADTINFDISGTGIHSIALSTILPAITEQVVINATTESDFAGTPLVVVSGENAISDGFTFSAGSDGSTLRGFIIQKFTNDGISISNSGGHTIAGNYIGLNSAGSAAAANGTGIELINSSLNTIGGTTTLDRNVISGNTGDGIKITGESADGNIVKNNYIGLAATGTAVLGNGGYGIDIVGGGDNTTIGAVGLGNIIAGNALGGTNIDGASSGASIYANAIGTDATGLENWGNYRDGITLQNGAADNIIGGTTSGQENIVAFNGHEQQNYAGIAIKSTAGSGNMIVGNSIYDNSGLGIDLGSSGVTDNDLLDADLGANNQQNYPVLTSATTNGSTVTLSGTINTKASSSGVLIHFYATPNSGELTRRDGRRYLGSTTVTTDASGNATFTNVSLSKSVSAGEIITATTTSAATNGNTSEFSQGLVATQNGGNSTPTSSQLVNVTEGGLTLNAAGNDTYLIAASGLTSALSAYTVEIQFSATDHGGDTALFSYNTAAGDVISLLVTADSRLEIDAHQSGAAYSSIIDYKTALLDGARHSLSVTWSNTDGSWQVFIDGVLKDVGSGLSTGQTIATGGAFVFGNEQDSLGGGLSPTQFLRGTLYEARLFNDVRTATEIVGSYRSSLPLNESGMVAQWKFDDLSAAGVSTASVGAFDLSVKHAVGSGFTAGSVSLTTELNENSRTGTVVGTFYGTDIERNTKITALLATDSTLRYSAETGKFYKLMTSTGTWSNASSGALATSLSGVAGQLATIRSATENALLTSLNNGGSSWLGASDSLLEGTWRWYGAGSAGKEFWRGTSSGYAVDGSYQNFAVSQPDDSTGAQDYLFMNASGAWDDTDSSTTKTSYIVEWNADDVLDASNSLTYSIVSQTVAGAFTINSDSGTITVANGNLLDYESQSNHSLTVRVSDGTSSFDKTLTIMLSDRTESLGAPTDLSNGLAINTDGGNAAYLMTSNGGSVFGGRTALTMEVMFAMSSNASSDNSLISYAVPAGSDDEVFLRVTSSGTLSLSINGATSTTTSAYAQLLDGKVHAIAASWDNTNGDIKFYVDGQLVQWSTGLKAGTILASGGTLVIGQDQDSVGGGYQSTQRFSGTLHDVRIWDSARSVEEIALNHQKLLSSLPTGLIADWKMTGLNGVNQVVDSVSANNLAIGNATGAGYVASTPITSWTVSEGTAAGTILGSVVGATSQFSTDIVADGLFRESSDPGPGTQYSAGQTFGGWTVGSGTVDLQGSSVVSSPLGGRSVELNGTSAGSIYQNLTTVAGRHYQVIFGLSGNFAGGEAVKDIRVSAAGQSQDYSFAQPAGWSANNMLWSGQSFEFTAAASVTQLSFASLDGANAFGANVADIRVIEIPDAVQRILNADSTLTYDAGTGKFYRGVNSYVNWTTAQSAATTATLNGVAGQLPTIGSRYENDLVRSMAAKLGDNVWLNASDSSAEGTWRWYSGTQLGSTFFVAGSGASTGNYTNWRSGEPNDYGGLEDCASLTWNTGEWYDFASTAKMRYVIEWDASEVLGSLTYTLTSNPGGGLAINSSTGEITVANTAALDYDTSTTKSFTIQVADGFGNTYSEVLTIALTPVNDNSPIITSNGGGASGSINVAEGATAVTTVVATDADLPTQSLVYSISGGADQSLFTINSATGALSFNSARNFETPTDSGGNNVYDVTVQASDGTFVDTQSIAVTITNVNESPTAVADTATAVEAGGVSNSVAGTSPTGNVLNNDTDIDNADTQAIVGVAAGTVGSTSGSVGSNVTGSYGSISIASGGGYTYTVDNSKAAVEALRTSANTLIDVFTYTMQDGAGITSTAQITITIQGVNDAPHDLSSPAMSIAENSVNGTLVGSLTTSDVDSGDTFTYQLTDNAGGRFAIDATSGAITVADGSALNYEAATSHTVTIRTTDASGATYDEAFVIKLTDVDEFDTSAVSDANAAANSVAENAAIGTGVGIIATASDADGSNNAITYSLLDNDGGRFAIHSSTGAITVAGAIDRETDGASRNITVTATSADGSTSNQTFTITIGDVDESDTGPVSDTDSAGNSVTENAVIGTVVGVTASASDPDATNNAVTYSLVNNDGGRFAIHSSTGVVTVAGAIDREAGANRNIVVRATSADGSTSDQTFTISVSDVDEFDTGAVGDANAAANWVAENAAIGTTVGITAAAADGDATNCAITYSLLDNDGGRFGINSSTGAVTVAGAIDREIDGASRTITIRATSADGSISDQSFVINVGDVNEFGTSAVSDSDATVNSVSENAAIGSAVGITAAASDADATNNAVTFTLLDNDGGRFAIDSTTGKVTVAGAIDREADGASRTIIIRATSVDGSTSSKSYTIAIGDIDEFDTSPITDTNAVANKVAENAANGTVINLTALATDGDATANGVSYSLDDDAAGRFAIDASSGVVTVADGGLLNYETASSHAITVRATSVDGSFSQQNFTILLSDVNEVSITPVTDSDAAANSVLENSAHGTAVGVSAWADDADGTDTVTYSLDDDAGGRFAIDSLTGAVTVAGAIDREAAASYNITIRATSTDTSSSTQSLTINVLDVDEFDTGAVSDSNATANAVAENAKVGTTVGVTAAASDGDATNNTISYWLIDDDGGRFTVDANSGVVTVSGAIDREADGPSRTIVIRATSADGSITDQTFSINVIDVDEFDTTPASDSDSTANAVAENAAIGTYVGVTGSASDADATNNAITYSLWDDDGGRFAVHSVTGMVSVAGAIDREADGANRTVIIRATSADGSTADHAYTITIGDVDEFDTTAVSDSDASPDAVAENAAIGTAIGVTAAASDADATNNAISYSLVDDDGGRFAIDSTTGIVRVAAAIDREADGPTRNIVVRATSADGSSQDRGVSIAIGDVDEFDTSAVSDSDATQNAVAENAAMGTAVRISGLASDADATTNAITYSLLNNDGGRFAIHSVTGLVTVAGPIDRETDGAVRTIVIRATSADSSFSDQTFSISINDVDEFDVSPISDLSGASNAVNENSPAGASVGVVANATDGDSTANAVVYSLDDSAGSRFAIDAATGAVTVATGSALDFEANSSHSIVVRATSADGSFSLRTFTIAVNDVNEFAVSMQSDTNASPNSVAENSAGGTLVGLQVLATDSDGTNNTVSYALMNDAGGRFHVNAATGMVSVAAGASLDHETSSSYAITVRASSSDGSFRDQAYTILINNVNESPLAASRVFTTDNVSKLVVTALDMMSSTIDPEGDVVTFNLIDAPDHGSLVIQSNGAFTYIPDSGFTGTDRFSIIASDGLLSSSATDITVNVVLPNAGSSGSSSGGTKNATSAGTSSGNTNSAGNNAATGAGDVNAAAGALAGFAIYTDESESGRQPEREAHHEAVVTGEVAAPPERSFQAEQRQSLHNSDDFQAELSFTSVIHVQREFSSTREDEVNPIRLHKLSDDTWLLEDDEKRKIESHDDSAFTFVAPAKWTVISTGMVLWAVRAGQVIATLASSASAFMPFDPLTVIQQANLNGFRDDDKDANSFTEQLFDNQQKK